MAGRRELGDVMLERWMPPVDDLTAFFWHAGAEGQLRMLRCSGCGYITHPPGPRCANCLGCNLTPDDMCGTGRVVTFTVNYQEWVPGQPPYIIAIVELDDQPGLRYETNLVGVDGDDVHIDMPVRVVFEEGSDGVWLPLFTPAAG